MMPAERGEQLPDIGDTVFYYDRDDVVRAHEQGRDCPRPHAAIVTGHETLDGERFLQVAQLHPEQGPIVRRHVRHSAIPEAHCWSWRPIKPAQTATVPFEQLTEAVQIALDKLMERAQQQFPRETTSTEGEDEANAQT